MRQGVAEIAARVRARLFDLSAFMKEFKQKLTLAYNSAHGRTGALWEGRYRCVRVGGGEALRAVAAYIDLNPVRAGLADGPEGYRWSSYAAAVGGMRLARAGLVAAISPPGRKLSWAKAAAAYRELLYVKGRAVAGGVTPDGRVESRGGFGQGRDRGGAGGWRAAEPGGGAALPGALLHRRGGAGQPGVRRRVLRGAAGAVRREPQERRAQDEGG